MMGIIIGDKRMEMALPELIAKTINSGGYGRFKFSKIPPTSTMTVNGPSPAKPRIMTINGNKYNRLISGNISCML